MRSLVLAAAMTTGLLSLPLTASAQAKANADEAMAVFTSQKCSLCHSIAGKGNKKGSLDGVGAKLKADEIRQWIVDPDGMRAKTNSTRTPVMKPAKLTKEQVDTLVAYLQTLKRPAADAK